MRGVTPLMVAAENRHFAVVRLSIAAVASVNANDGAKFAALHWAAMNRDPETIRCLDRRRWEGRYPRRGRRHAVTLGDPRSGLDARPRRERSGRERPRRKIS